jgi:GTP-binding protein
MSAFPNAKYLKGAHQPSQFVSDNGVEVAFAGRSNAGKSSAINAITQRQGLAKTSKTPGATQLINFFELEGGVRLADLPGYGFAKVPRPLQEHWKSLLETYFRDRHSLRVMFLIVDARRGLKDQDFEMIEFAASCDRAVHVLLTKADKLVHSQQLKVRRDTEKLLHPVATCQLFSALSKLGVDEARKHLKRHLSKRKTGDDVSSPD